ncbi:MAG: aminotransferase class V-fold PLP-dependent enzyme [Gemmatimonadales bacterium]
MSDRRQFVRNAALLGAAFAFPGAEWLEAAHIAPQRRDGSGGLGRSDGSHGARPRPADPSLLAARSGPVDEAYWRLVRSQFLLSPRGVYFNTGTIGASPRPVVDAVVEHLRAFETVFEARGFDGAALRRSTAALVGAPPETLVFTRNTTESMNYVANGLDLAPGDEILMTTHEHVGGLCPWQLVARRRNLVLTQFPLPVPPQSARQVLDAWRERITPRTKVLTVSHILFSNGLIQPLRELCALARERGIITAVDGAHGPGLLPLDLAASGCDFYCASPHKWLLAPKGSGLLYIAEPWLDRLWPTIASGGWDDLSIKAERFDHKGTLNESLLVGFQAAVDFNAMIGQDRIWARCRELAERLYAGLARIEGVEIKSATDAALRAPLISFTVAGWTADDLIRALWERGPVRVRHVAEYDYHWVRMSTHVYNSPEEVDRVLGIVADLARLRRQG